MAIGTNNWDLGTYCNKLEKKHNYKDIFKPTFIMMFTNLIFFWCLHTNLMVLAEGGDKVKLTGEKPGKN